MVAIRVDPAWVSGYAKKVAEAADELAKGAEVLNTAPLSTEAFGALGRTVRTAESYGRAAEVLRAQLTRGVEALESAAVALGQVAEKYRGSDEEGASTIKRSGRG
ncbi:type VII secretion target [Actinokineospora iranica]|uniref:Excreted virulence factor EspC, type VII ESX diderm n=1 Tax=Actinokineospora iranica TaxID=1271860 RepID=A0A1G6V2D0_9PSEU|nr:type VII secretion target [Actinokineospora iranica]SDD47644.1 Excreted virulence factor EspC, type VII ESX diderm [Actinokineospora iranica]